MFRIFIYFILTSILYCQSTLLLNDDEIFMVVEDNSAAQIMTNVASE